VTGFRGATGPYTLNSLFLPADDHLDVLYLGSPLPANGTLQGALSRDGDLDAFAIEVPVPGTLTVSSSGALDLMAALYDGNGNLIAFNDDAAGAGNFNFSITQAVAPGLYYVGVVGFDPSARGQYTITSRFTAGGGPVQGQAVEYFHAGFGHYFVTALPGEVTALDAGTVPGWARTGETFSVFPLGAAGSSPVCRFFTTRFAPRSSHFYTPFEDECLAVRGNATWTFEGVVFNVAVPDGAGNCPAATRPLYRLYNEGRSGAPNHRYTVSVTVRGQMLSQGWTSEGYGPQGVVACVPN
jgi:hypothetical protein